MSEFHGYQVWTDGGNRGGNPGCAAGACIIQLPDGERISQVKLLPCATNNEAEYTGLILALRYLMEEDPPAGFHVLIHSDSQLMVRQVNGDYQCNSTLRPLWEEAVGMFEFLKSDEAETLSMRLVHVPREQNKEADRLCADFLDAHTNSKRKMK